MKLLNFFLVSIIIAFTANAQKVAMKIGTNPATISPSAVLEIESTTKGLLLPRMTSAQRIAIVTPSAGLQVYDTTLNLVYTYNGTVWVTNWSSTGNAGTNPATNFIGTTDGVDVVFRRAGVSSGLLNTANTSFGYYSLNSSSTGVNNSAFGSTALQSNTTGQSNVATGVAALQRNTTGTNNNAFGVLALGLNTTGQSNVAMGGQALWQNNASYNTSIGVLSCYAVTSGTNNTAVGYGALGSLTTGSNNTVIGNQTAGGLVTGSNNTIIGANINLISALSNNIILADGLGNQRINVDGYGNVGIGTKAPGYTLDVVGNMNASVAVSSNYISALTDIRAWRDVLAARDLQASNNVNAGNAVNAANGMNSPSYNLTSDIRLKRNIKNIDNALHTIGALRPVSYEKKTAIEASVYTMKEDGFIAQELQKVLPDLVNEMPNKDKTLSVNYIAIIPILTKAIQEQQEIIVKEQEKNKQLEARLKAIEVKLHL